MLFRPKQKTAYEIDLSDWSSDVCSSDLPYPTLPTLPYAYPNRKPHQLPVGQLPVASCKFELSQLAKLVNLTVFVAEEKRITASQLPVGQLPFASCNCGLPSWQSWQSCTWAFLDPPVLK